MQTSWKIPAHVSPRKATTCQGKQAAADGTIAQPLGIGLQNYQLSCWLNCTLQLQHAYPAAATMAQKLAEMAPSPEV